MSSANLVSVIFAEEVVAYDTVEAAATWETLRFTGESITATPSTATSDEIRSDRMIADQFKVSTESGGGFDFEFSGLTFDTLLEGAMYDTWATGVLKIGVEEHSYSFEKEFTDLTANQFMLFTGERVGAMSLGFTYGEAVKGSFELAGASVEVTSTTNIGTGSVSAATTSRIMNAVSDLSGIKIDTVAFTGCLKSVELNINNNLRPAECIGSDTPGDQIAGTAEVTGTIEAYLTDVTVQWYTDKVLNQTAMEIEFAISDGTTTYTFLLPNCRISGETPNAEGINTDVMIKADFTALYDATEGSSLVITKS